MSTLHNADVGCAVLRRPAIQNPHYKTIASSSITPGLNQSEMHFTTPFTCCSKVGSSTIQSDAQDYEKAVPASEKDKAHLRRGEELSTLSRTKSPCSAQSAWSDDAESVGEA